MKNVVGAIALLILVSLVLLWMWIVLPLTLLSFQSEQSVETLVHLESLLSRIA